MASFWSAALIVAVCTGATGAGDVDVGVKEAITKWLDCKQSVNHTFNEDLKLQFLLKLFSHNSLKDVLEWVGYDCSLEGMAWFMIQDSSIYRNTGKLFRTTFTRPQLANETEQDIMDLAATTMKDAFGKKDSTILFGCNYCKKDGNHEVLCVFTR